MLTVTQHKKKRPIKNLKDTRHSGITLVILLIILAIFA
jgi:hypothetical protein